MKKLLSGLLLFWLLLMLSGACVFYSTLFFPDSITGLILTCVLLLLPFGFLDKILS